MGCQGNSSVEGQPDQPGTGFDAVVPNSNSNCWTTRVKFCGCATIRFGPRALLRLDPAGRPESKRVPVVLKRRPPASQTSGLRSLVTPLSRDMSRVETEKKPVTIGLSRCHGSKGGAGGGRGGRRSGKESGSPLGGSCGNTGTTSLSRRPGLLSWSVGAWNAAGAPERLTLQTPTLPHRPRCYGSAVIVF